MSLVIQCGPTRRILRYSHGWKLEKLSSNGNWREDSPAWPANLGQAAEMVLERTLADATATTPAGLPAELAHAIAAVEDYFARARQVGEDLEADEIWNRAAHAADAERKDILEGRRPSRAERDEDNRSAGR